MKKKLVERKNDVEVLINIIKNKNDYQENSENGLVILLNGEWGTGKTTLLREFVEKIEKNDELELFNVYNAYEHDYYDNAYIPFFASIEDKIELKAEFSNFIKSVGEKSINSFIVISYAVTKGIFQKTLKIDIDDVKENLKDIQDEKINNDYLNNYNNFKKYKKQITDRMNKICKEKTQIFIIDELDRCKPTFAIDTLEIIKHFFDIENCIFIVSIDKIQLEESIKCVYGNGINSEKYFSKLFDYQHNLLSLDFYNIVDYSDISHIGELVGWSTKVFNLLNISSRDSKKVFNELINKNSSWTIRQSMFVLFLLILKYTDLAFYTAIINKDYLKYKNIIEKEYNSELEKYNKLINFKIGDGLTYGLILEELDIYLNYDYSKLTINSKNETRFFANIRKSAREIEQDIKDYIPEIYPGLTVKQTIKKIVG